MTDTHHSSGEMLPLTVASKNFSDFLMWGKLSIGEQMALCRSSGNTPDEMRYYVKELAKEEQAAREGGDQVDWEWYRRLLAPIQEGVVSWQSDQKALPPVKKVDPAVKAAILASMTDYKIAAAPLTIEEIEKPLTYVLTGSGAKLIKKTAIGIGIRPIEKIPSLPELENGFVLSIPKLPFPLVQNMFAFFKEVYKEHKAEAVVQFFYDPPTNNWHLHIPTQEVSGGSADHASGFDPGGDTTWIHVADVHSHASMGAFWSGTDDRDELKAERLYGVFGNLDRENPSWKWRVNVNGIFLDLKIAEVVDLPADDIILPFTIPHRELFGTPDDKGNIWIKINPFEGGEVPEGAMAKVSKWASKGTTYAGHPNVTYYHGRGQSHSNGDGVGSCTHGVKYNQNCLACNRDYSSSWTGHMRMSED